MQNGLFRRKEEYKLFRIVVVDGDIVENKKSQQLYNELIGILFSDLDIKLLDHLIITPEGKYFSFADEGLL